jgi:hypothetical protein
MPFSASDYMVGSAPQGVSYQAPQIGMQLGQMIAGYPQAYMQGQENQRKLAVMNAFPNGVPPGASVNDLVSTIAKAGGGQYIQQLLPFMIQQQMMQGAGKALSDVDKRVYGSGPTPNIGPANSDNASGPANITPSGQSAQGSPTTVMTVLAAQGIPNDQLGAASRYVVDQLNQLGIGVGPTDAINTKDPRVAGILGPAIAQLKNGGVGQVYQPGEAAPAPQTLPFSTPASEMPPQKPQKTGNLVAGPPFASNQSQQPALQQSARSPTAPTASREDTSALGSEAELRNRMDNLNREAGNVEEYAGATAAVNPAVSTAALAKARAFREEAARIFEYISKGDQAAYEHQLRQEDLTPAEKESGRSSAQIAAFKSGNEQLRLLAKQRADIAESYETRGTQAEKALPLLQYQQKLVNSPGFYGGAGKGYIDALNNLGASLGLKTGASVNQIFDKMRSSTVLDGIRSMAGTGPVRVAEMNVIDKATGDRSNQNGSLRAIMTMQQRAYQKELEIRDLIHKNGSIINDSVQAGIDRIMSRGLFSPKELQHPEMLQMPRFDSPQEAQSSSLPRGTRYIGGGERVFMIQ